MSTNQLKSVLAQIEREAIELSSEERFVRTVREGDEIRQGDVYLYPRADFPQVDRGMRHPLQLAPGDQPGSRHIVAGNAMAFYRLRTQSALDGPWLWARERVVLTHPEHADISLPAGWYEVRYQRDWSRPLEARGMPQRHLD